MNLIEWRPKAVKQLRKIADKALREQIYDSTQILKEFPDCANIKKLTQHTYSYRLRVGSYRVFFEFDGIVKVVSIEEVKKRDEHTY